MIFLILFSSLVHSYVPSVESLFRNGANKDVTTNSLSIQAKVEKVSSIDAPLVENLDVQYFRWIYQSSGSDKLKMVQLQYSHPSFGDHFIIDKYFVSQLNPLIFTGGARGVDQGMFYSLMNSLLINDASFLIDFLKSKGVTASLNDDAINGEKRVLLEKYKHYIAELAKNNKTDNPLEPSDRVENNNIQKVSRSPFIRESLHVKLEKWRDDFCWKVESDVFEACVTDQKREIAHLLYKSPDGDFEAFVEDFYLMDGVHKFPRVVSIRTSMNEFYKIQFSDLQYFSETEAGFLTRLKKLDQKNQNKRPTSRPPFVF